MNALLPRARAHPAGARGDAGVPAGRWAWRCSARARALDFLWVLLAAGGHRADRPVERRGAGAWTPWACCSRWSPAAAGPRTSCWAGACRASSRRRRAWRWGCRVAMLRRALRARHGVLAHLTAGPASPRAWRGAALQRPPLHAGDDALGRCPARTFGILMSLEPAVAALRGPGLPARAAHAAAVARAARGERRVRGRDAHGASRAPAPAVRGLRASEPALVGYGSCPFTAPACGDPQSGRRRSATRGRSSGAFTGSKRLVRRVLARHLDEGHRQQRLAVRAR